MDTEPWQPWAHSWQAALLWLLWPVALPQSLCGADPESAPPGLGGSPAPAARWPLGAQRLASAASGSVCGKPMGTGKIFGGQDAAEAQWPWQASLQHRGVHVCGAVLVDPHWVVSAAHCFNKKSHAPKDYWVTLGSAQLYQDTLHTQRVAVSRIIIHPDFDKRHHFVHDIAMLQLLQPVNFTSHIVPVCLPAPGLELPPDTPCWITGWGKLSEQTGQLPPPYALQEGKVQIIGNQLCNNLYEEALGEDSNFTVEEEMLCVVNFSQEKGICNGDSGGPLVCDFSKTWVLLGVASRGLDCQHPMYPSIFTRVARFTKWIVQIQRLTPLPVSWSVPSDVPVLEEPQQVSSSAVTTFTPPQHRLLLLLVPTVLWRALQ